MTPREEIDTSTIHCQAAISCSHLVLPYYINTTYTINTYVLIKLGMGDVVARLQNILGVLDDNVLYKSLTYLLT